MITQYFRVLAGSHKQILHSDANKAFHRIRSRMDLEEFENAVRSMTGTSCMLLELGPGTIGNTDRPSDSPRIGIHILFLTDEIYANQELARSRAKSSLESLLTRLNYDRLEADLRTDGQDGPLRVAGVKFDGSGQYDDMMVDPSWHGKSLYINLTIDKNLIYNPNDWN